MRFLLDQDVYAATSRRLLGLGHDAVTASKAGLSRSTDSDLLEAAARQNRIDTVHQELVRALGVHSEAELMKAFVVIEPGRHRFRTLPGR